LLHIFIHTTKLTPPNSSFHPKSHPALRLVGVPADPKHLRSLRYLLSKNSRPSPKPHPSLQIALRRTVP
jgi:hypothetical protein